MTDFDPRKIFGGQYPPKFDKVKLGSGVVGKLTSSMIALIGLMTVIAWGLMKEPVYLLYLSLFALTTFVFYVFSILWFATRNPASAALEGADFVAYRRLEMASKTGGEVIDGTLNQSTQSLPKNKKGGDVA